jgi:DNA processing protein
MAIVRLSPADAAFAGRLRNLSELPDFIDVEGRVDHDGMAVAIVGRRKASPRALELASTLAHELAQSGVVVVSGGAFGVDAAAHEGAMRGGGRTWLVSPASSEYTYPGSHAGLYADVVASGGAVIWPFPRGTPAQFQTFFARNRVLVALADHVVIAQADQQSGALNAAKWARMIGRPVWAVFGGPWDEHFEGCRALIHAGHARHFESNGSFLRTIGVGIGKEAQDEDAQPGALGVALESAERTVWFAARDTPTHRDEIILVSALPTPTVAAALLTLTLKNVLVEGPPGFFRKRI